MENYYCFQIFNILAALFICFVFETLIKFMIKVVVTIITKFFSMIVALHIKH